MSGATNQYVSLSVKTLTVTGADDEPQGCTED